MLTSASSQREGAGGRGVTVNQAERMEQAIEEDKESGEEEVGSAAGRENISELHNFVENPSKHEQQDRGEFSLRELTGETHEPHEREQITLSREELLEALRSSQRVAQHLSSDCSSLQRELSALRSLHSRCLSQLRSHLNNAASDCSSRSATADGEEDKDDETAWIRSASSLSPEDEIRIVRRVACARGVLAHEGDVQLGHQLGQGTGGTVYSATWRAADVAVKVKRADNSSGTFGAHREAVCMLRCRHPKCVPLHAVIAEPEELKLWLIMEAMEESVSSWLRKPSGRASLLSTRLSIAQDVAQALASLEAEDVLHRDVKPSNCFICSSTADCKLADFGLATIAGAQNDGSQGPTPETGTSLLLNILLSVQ